MVVYLCVISVIGWQPALGVPLLSPQVSSNWLQLPLPLSAKQCKLLMDLLVGGWMHRPKPMFFESLNSQICACHCNTTIMSLFI